MYLAFDMANWSWPQWFYFGLMVLVLVLAAFLHGHKRTGHHSFPAQFVGFVLGLFVLTAGGFFA